MELDFDIEWSEKRIELEGDCCVSAGRPPKEFLIVPEEATMVCNPENISCMNIIDHNEEDFKIIRQIRFMDFVVMEVDYPDCPMRNKIMVFNGNEPSPLATSINPHFGKLESPVARFNPEQNGWHMAVEFAKMASCSFCIENKPKNKTAKRKKRKSGYHGRGYKHLLSFPPEEILPLTDGQFKRRDFIVKDKQYSVKMTSDRYDTFRKGCDCVVCGLKGTEMILDLPQRAKNPHFNLYGRDEQDKLVLLTKDHIVPKSKGGSDHVNNYQTMCSICNGIKGNYFITFEQILELRQIYTSGASKLDRMVAIDEKRREMNIAHEE